MFIFGAVIATLLLMVAFSLPQPDFYKNQLIILNDKFLTDIDATTQQLLAVKGIKQAVISVEEGIAYLKLDKLELDESELELFVR